MAPTRDLALRIQKIVLSMGKYLDINVNASVGGKPVIEDIEAFKKGPQIVVGTPGRVSSMIMRGFFQTDDIKMFFISEFDEVLSTGFKEQIYKVFKSLPPTTQVVLMPASVDMEVLEVVDEFMRDPIRITMKKQDWHLEGIKQYYVNVNEEQDKFDRLCDLYDSIPVTQAVIFCSTRRTLQELTKRFTHNKFTVSAIHSELSQDEKDIKLKEFRTGASRI
ncbi:unnamed protein product [Ambrosiozyma monospora]|uniref:Unnamed protein product n=1 Tax=Ambrosiozyma monospora TaxID=43982 RepID=A0ACB5TGV2_AMBMO|nr:unnamed protein product [Ambrosiozyma monospora]